MTWRRASARWFLILAGGGAFAILGPQHRAEGAPAPSVVSLFQDWRRFVVPKQVDGAADFSAAALSEQRAGIEPYRRRIDALAASAHDRESQVDLDLIRAEVDGLDFDLRVLRPWSRDPSFYRTVFGEESDVPAHEGQSADVIDLFKYRYPLSAGDAASLANRLRGVPRLLARARVDLQGSNAADLWRYGDRTFTHQEKILSQLLDGSLTMRTFNGHENASLKGAPEAVRKAAQDAMVATREFRDWVKAQAPTKNGPSGVGIENYDWYMQHVQCVPYSWAEQIVLLKRELARADAALAEEEWHHRALPPLRADRTPAAYRAFDDARMATYVNFVMDNRFAPDEARYRAALAAQKIGYVPPGERDFFSNVTSLDPLPLYSHDIHWVELAKIRFEPNADPVRAGAPLFNIYAARSEGFATGFEELVMRAGLYDSEPRGRELVWIMLANRAARGLASLYVQANRMDLAMAGKFHAAHTPRGYSDPDTPLVGFEQMLYLRQPGYGTSYVTGKILMDRTIAEYMQQKGAPGSPATLPDALNAIYGVGIVPWPLVEKALDLRPLTP